MEQQEYLLNIVTQAMEDMKAKEISTLDVSAMTSVTDYMVIASGTSNRHIQAIANYIVEKAKDHGIQPLGQEGHNGTEWVLVDLGDVVAHIMLPHARDFYQLERLWSHLEEHRAHTGIATTTVT